MKDKLPGTKTAIDLDRKFNLPSCEQGGDLVGKRCFDYAAQVFQCSIVLPGRTGKGGYVLAAMAEFALQIGTIAAGDSRRLAEGQL